MYRSRTPRFRGGSGRGFRSRGRRGHYYQPRAQYNSSPSGPVSLPPASTSYATPVERLSNQTPGVVPSEGTTANVERLASTPAPKSTLYAQSTPQVAPPASHEGRNPPAVPLLAEQNVPSTGAQSVSDGSTNNPEQPQALHESQVEKVDTSVSEGGGVAETNEKHKSTDGSSSPTDLYLYGPQSDSSGGPESVLGKRKEPPPQDGQGDGGGREGEEDEQDATKKPKVSFPSCCLMMELRTLLCDWSQRSC